MRRRRKASGRPAPESPGSLKFGVLGDFGTRAGAVPAGRADGQACTAISVTSWSSWSATTSTDRERPQDFKTKFEVPYKPLLDAGVKFYASLGNHDAREQRYYKPFNMDGKLYYSFKAPKQNVRFFALESTYPEPEQIAWSRRAQRRERATGRFRSSTTRSIPPASGTVPTPGCARSWSRCSSSTASASSSPATITSTSGPSCRRGSPTSSSGRAASCAAATSIAAPA